MPRKQKQPVNLEKLADDANDALNFLWSLGYRKEVEMVRTLIHEQGEYLVFARKQHQKMVVELGRQIDELKGKRGAPTA